MGKIKNILVAPDKFKFTLSTKEIVNSICSGLSFYESLNIYKLPLADGGEGTSDILSNFFNAKRINISVNNPVFNKIDTYYYYSKKSKTAIIDLASASGLYLLKKEEQNPMSTSSYGTGEIILDTINKGAKKIIIGIGGSATNDLGIGAFNALGYRFLDNKGNDLSPIGKNLIHISKIDSSNVNSLLNNVKIIVLYDVENILYGKNGASHVFASQKGANNKEIKILDMGLRNISELVKSKFSKDVSNVIGGGAAGGFGAGALAFFNSSLKQGSNFIFDTTNIDDYIKKSDLIITGEGKFDKQSLDGKLTGELIKKAEKFKIPIVVICGQSEINLTYVKSKYLHSIIPLFNHEVDMKTAKKQSKYLLMQKSKEIIRFLNKDIYSQMNF